MTFAHTVERMLRMFREMCHTENVRLRKTIHKIREERIMNINRARNDKVIGLILWDCMN